MQIQTSVELVRWLDYAYGIDYAYGHQELNPESVCPGANAMPNVYIFKELVQEVK